MAIKTKPIIWSFFILFLFSNLANDCKLLQLHHKVILLNYPDAIRHFNFRDLPLVRFLTFYSIDIILVSLLPLQNSQTMGVGLLQCSYILDEIERQQTMDDQ